jgi:thiamine pyrophosphokinase
LNGDLRKRRTCYIVGAGTFVESARPRGGDYIIAADGGYEALVSRGYATDLVCGDFDSLGYTPEHPNVITHPSAKDETDMALAVKYGMEHGCGLFVINGGMGGRPDHTFGNIQLLARIARGQGRGFLAGGDINMTAVSGGEARFTSAARGYISVFAFGGMARGIDIEGLKYTLKDADMFPDVPLGVSNEFLGAPSRVRVRSGTLVIMWRGDLYETSEELIINN